MNVILGCEESQAVCIEFRRKGHNAYSVDLQPCSGGHPKWHIRDDVFKVIGGGMFITQAGDLVEIEKWDLGIMFPPCTHLAVSGAKHFEKKRADGRQRQGIDFFMRMVNASIDKLSLENPMGIMSTLYRKPDQIIQPWYFGDEAQKTTCLWLKNLPLLFHAAMPDLFNAEVTHVGKGEFYTSPQGKKLPKWYGDAEVNGKKIAYGSDLMKKIRSATFPGIARAMAEQWG